MINVYNNIWYNNVGNIPISPTLISKYSVNFSFVLLLKFRSKVIKIYIY